MTMIEKFLMIWGIIMRKDMQKGGEDLVTLKMRTMLQVKKLIDLFIQTLQIWTTMMRMQPT